MLQSKQNKYSTLSPTNTQKEKKCRKSKATPHNITKVATTTTTTIPTRGPKPTPSPFPKMPSTTATHHPHLYYPPSTTQSSSATFRGCCCCLFLLFSFLFLLILATILVIFLAVKPKKPEFQLQQVFIQNMGISPITPSSATVSLNIHLIFSAVNDNKVAIKYADSSFTIMYHGIPLGRGELQGFEQNAHSVKKVEIVIGVDRVSLIQADAADLVRDAEMNDRVELRVVGDVGAKIKIMGVTSPGVEVSVVCTIGISPRRQALTSKVCGFDGLSV